MKIELTTTKPSLHIVSCRFFQCFMVGLLLLVNLPEAMNGTEHFGRLTNANAALLPATSSSSASSTASSGSGSRRLLLGAAGPTCWQTENCKEGMGQGRRRLGAAVCACPSKETPVWAFCRDFAPDWKVRDETLIWSYNVQFNGSSPFTADNVE